MFGLKNHKQIEVQLFEHGAKERFAYTLMEIDKLPDTYEIETKMFTKDDEWRVVDAIPKKKSEFAKTGKLSLYLRKDIIGKMPTGDLLFMIPTVSTDWASMENCSKLDNVIVLHEDDWRQEECVSAKFKDLIIEDLKSIEDIYKNHRLEKTGFKKLHVRETILQPFEDKTLTLEQLKVYFPVTKLMDGVAFTKAAAIVKEGFAYFSDHV